MRKTLDILKTVFTWLIIVTAISIMIFTIVSVSTFDQSHRSLFGYKAFIVLSDSMSKTDFDAGDLVLVKEVDPTILQEGDIIAYQSTNTANYGETVTHKIRSLGTDANGNPGFVTYGTTTDIDDEGIVTYPYVLGKYQTYIPSAGTFFQFLKTTPGYILCIFLPFMLLILLQGFKSIALFRRYKAEQLAELKMEQEKQHAELEAERKRIEAERAESQKMMAEILKLREQLSSTNRGNGSNSGVDADADTNANANVNANTDTGTDTDTGTGTDTDTGTDTGVSTAPVPVPVTDTVADPVAEVSIDIQKSK